MSDPIPEFSKDVLVIDCARVADEICQAIRENVFERFRRKGVVLGLSGGIDSSVCATLATYALGRERVLGLRMPDRESANSKESHELGGVLAEHLGIQLLTEDISDILEASGCYSRRDASVREVIPEYAEGWKCKIVLPSLIDNDRFRTFSVVARSPGGETIKKRLNLSSHLGVVAAMNFKQRVRKMMEYYHADRLHRVVLGTPNRLEYDQGFFVKGGDGQADIKPIAHLYKSQVYQLAAHFGLPRTIQDQPPTTDTYSLPQTQEEFYFPLAYEKMDLCLWALNHAVSPEQASQILGLTAEQVSRVYRDIESKRRNAVYLHAAPVVLSSELV